MRTSKLIIGIISIVFTLSGFIVCFEKPMANLVGYFSKLIIWLSESKSEVRFTEPSFTRLK
ncbi:MAG: hypothetical protein NTV31_08485 [Bacteroidia bacterium]|nr:hypothetical protein [Bacteroidia bacterium]